MGNGQIMHLRVVQSRDLLRLGCIERRCVGGNLDAGGLLLYRELYRQIENRASCQIDTRAGSGFESLLSNCQAIIADWDEVEGKSAGSVRDAGPRSALGDIFQR